jgi:hypothetical protein
MKPRVSPSQARRLNLLAAQAAHMLAIPAPVIDGHRISVSCAPCGLSVDAPNNDFGRALIADWPAIHAKDYKPAKRSNP